MTDVPLVAVETWTLVFFARAWRRDSSRDLWIGTALACCAAAIRVVGLVPALAMSAALLFHERSRRALVPLASLPLTGALLCDYTPSRAPRRRLELHPQHTGAAPRCASLNTGYRCCRRGSR